MLENIDLSHYHMVSLDQYRQDFPALSDTDAERDWLETFLIQTDYQITKASECQLLGQPVPEDIKTLISARQEARERINELEGGLKS